MELINATDMNAAHTIGLDPDGRERVVVVIKGTFSIPQKGCEPVLLDTQEPIVMADVHTGEPGKSAVLYESEFAPFKPYCDVLLNGSAYSPGVEPDEYVQVALQVGSWNKQFYVFGERHWKRWGPFIWPSSPMPFKKTPISYDFAYGGSDPHPHNKDICKAHEMNPVGVGYLPYSKGSLLEDKCIANTSFNSYSSAGRKNGHRKPFAFGSLVRNSAERVKWAGTYDDQWLEDVFPFLPHDFDPRYYQSAPEDQQIDYPEGGETVVLINLTPDCTREFVLPAITVPVEFCPLDNEPEKMTAFLDTILFEPDAERFMLVWRASYPIKRDIFEMGQIVVGNMSKGWYRARELGKTYYRSLDQLIRQQTNKDEPDSYVNEEPESPEVVTENE